MAASSGRNNTFSSTNAHSTQQDTHSRTPSMADTLTHPQKPAPVLKLASHERNDLTNTTSSDTRVDSAISPEDCYSESTIDEKQWQHRYSSQHHETRHSMSGRHHDVEKANLSTPRSSNHTLAHLNPRDSLHSRGNGEDYDQLQAKKSVRILLYLAGPCVAVSFMNLFFTVLALVITLLYQPLRLCTPRLSSSQQIRHLLTPILNLHLRGIHSRLFPLPSEEIRCSALWLVIVHVMAPFLSIPLAIASWTVAVYWCLASVVGDPSGTDKRDDGIEAVLGLRRWWENFISHAVKL